MSEQDEQPKPSSLNLTQRVALPSKQTSSIPLMKETVRVTLKAADAPVSTTGPVQFASPVPPPPIATTPLSAMAPPKAPPMAPPKPTVALGGAAMMPPKPTAALGGAMPPKPAPTIQLRPPGSGPATKPAGGPAPTIRLGTKGPASTQPATSPSAPITRPGLPGAPPPTIALGGARPSLPGAKTTTSAPSTQLLPKATVQLAAPTQPLTAGGSAATVQTNTNFRVQQNFKPEQPPTSVKVLASLSLVASIGILTTQLLVSNVWLNAPLGLDSQENPRIGDWSRLLE